MIFPKLQLEDIVQVSDKTRLDATRSFVSKDEAAITLVEIEPESGDGFIDVTGSSSRDWYLDWEYSGVSRTAVSSVRITTDGSPVTFTENIEVITEADDKLFSSDQDLTAVEPDILKWLRDDRSSMIDVHRKAQTLILDYLNDIGARNYDYSKITKASVVDLNEVRKWSENIVLRLIFEGLSNSVDDIFSLKAQFYRSQEAEARKKSMLKLDLNADGDIDTGEFVNFKTMDLIRR